MKSSNALKNLLRVPNLGKLRALCRQLLLIVQTPPKLDNKGDSYGLYLLLFFNRIESHLTSSLKLGNSKDAWLVARSALEGAAWTKWMSKNPVKHAEIFREHLYREMYNHAIRLRDIGIPIDNQSLFILTFGKDEGNLLKMLHPTSGEEARSIRSRKKLKGSATKKLVDKEPREFIKSNFGEYGEYIATTYYDRFSEFQHWSPRQMVGLINWDSSVTYLGNDEMYSALALEACFISFHSCLECLNNYFHLGLNTHLTSLNDKFFAVRKTITLDMYM